MVQWTALAAHLGLRLSPQPSPTGQLVTVTPVPGSTPFSGLTGHCKVVHSHMQEHTVHIQWKRSRADALHAW